MFKENYMKELALCNIKKQYHLYKYMVVALIMSFFLSSFLSVIFTSYEKMSFVERANQYGKWSVAIENSTRDNVNIDFSCEEGKVYFLSDVYDRDRQIGKLGALDDKGLELANLKIIEGRFPQNSNEIIIEQSQCDYLGISDQLNQNITIRLSDDNGIVDKELKLVGILDNYSLTYPIEIPSFMTIAKSDDYTLLLNGDDNLGLMNYFVNTNQEKFVIYNYSTYTQYVFSEDQYIESDTTKYMKFIIVSIGFIGVFATMLSAINKRTEYFALMRSLGATMFQIQKTILYECLFLIVPSMLIGVFASLILVVICLLLYQFVMGGPLIIDISFHLIWYNVLLMISIFFSMFIVSLSIYNIPLTYKVKQKSYRPKKRRIRKLNILSLSILEINNNRRGFCLLGIVASFIILLTCFMVSTCASYLNQNNDIGFTHSLSGDAITNNDFERISTIDHLETIYFQYEQVRIYVDGLENWDGQYYEGSSILPYQHWLSDSVISCYLDKNNALKNIISQQNFNGRMPQNDNETLVIIPMIDIANSRKSFLPVESNKIEQHHIQLGDDLEIADLTNNKLLPQKLKVVGTVTYKYDDKKMQDLTSYGGYQFIVSPSTYESLFHESMYKTIYINAYDNNTIHKMKSIIYDLMKEKINIDYSDNISMNMLTVIQQKKDFIKNCSFMILFIIGVVGLLYIQRKLRVLSIKHDIGLMIAVGLTKIQLILMFVIYDVFVYLIGLVLVNIYFVITNIDHLYLLTNIIFTSTFALSLFLSWILISFFMIIPIIIQKKQNIIEMLTKED